MSAPKPYTPPPPLEGTARLIGTIALSVATFMNVLDSSIANVSLPAIAGDLGVSPNQGTWVITSFGVANAISLPLTGWLSQRFGQVRLFVISILLFVMSSWMCGMAPNMSFLIGARALQGFVAGPLMPLAQTLLLSSYPPALAGTAMALWAMTTLVAPVMGPLLGGWITDNAHWGWIFFINVPVGFITAFVTWGLFRHRETQIRKLPIDTVGLSLLVISVSAIQLMLDQGKDLDWFRSDEIIILTVVSLVALAYFIVWELTDKHPVVDIRLFKLRNFWSGTVAISVAYALFMGNIVLLPLWLQQFMGYTATRSGMLMAPVGIFAIILSPIIGKNITKVDTRILATIAFLVFSLVLWLRSRFSTMSDFNTMMIPTLIQGIALSLFFIPLTSIILGGLPGERIASASGLSSFVRVLCGSFGTSIATTVWQSRTTIHHAQLTEMINHGSAAANSALEGLGAAGLSNDQALSQVARMIDQQAATLAANDVFYASAAIFILLIPLVWLARPKRGGGGGAADAAAAAH